MFSISKSLQQQNKKNKKTSIVFKKTGGFLLQKKRVYEKIKSMNNMNKKIKNKIYSLLLTSYFLLFAHVSPVFAQKAWTSGEEDPAQFKDMEIVFENILGIIFPVAGIAIFIMLLIGGFQKLTSGGDPKANQKSRNTITFAIVGLFLLVGIWFILRFIEEFTGVGVTEFELVSE
jgi:hypothetical protein